MDWLFKKFWQRPDPATTAEEVNKVVEPVFNYRTLVTPGRYPKAEILEAVVWESLRRGKTMLRLEVSVNPDSPDPDLTGHIYLTPIETATLFDNLYVGRWDLDNLVGEYIAVESFQVEYAGYRGYRLEIAGPKVVWKTESGKQKGEN